MLITRKGIFITRNFIPYRNSEMAFFSLFIRRNIYTFFINPLQSYDFLVEIQKKEEQAIICSSNSISPHFCEDGRGGVGPLQLQPSSLRPSGGSGAPYSSSHPQE
jgi:hypothetical protein